MTMADLKSIGDQATTDLAEDLTALRDDISRLSASVLELVQQQAATTKSQVFDAVDGARQRFADQSAEAKDRARRPDQRPGNRRSSAIRFTAIFAGALAGFLIGILVRPTR